MSHGTEPVALEAGKQEVLRQMRAMELSWEELTFEVKEEGKTKRILDGVSGVLRPGELVAIMGPSGAGKSTMMNVLAGRAPYGERQGKVRLNGDEVDPESYRRRIAYVMQEDALFATQTPREMLHFTAGLRRPELSGLEREELVNETLAMLGLGDCADTLVGSALSPGLSGGEKKRAAVAAELVCSPSVIFLDEPTSGLDAFSAYRLVQVLRDLAGRGCTVVCTIHQPSSEVFAMFDRVMLLRYGRMVYFGGVGTMAGFFAEHGRPCKANYNPSDFAMFELKQMSDEDAAPLEDTARAAGAAEAAVAAAPARVGVEADDDNGAGMRSGSLMRELRYLTVREVWNVLRDRTALKSRYGATAVLVLLSGLAFQGAGSDWGEGDEVSNHFGALVFLATALLMMSVQPLLLAFPIERPVFMREYTSGTYSTTAYFLAKSAVDVPSALVQSLVGLVGSYWLMDLQGNFGLLVLALTLMSVVASSTALVIGAAVREAQAAMQVAPAAFVPQILFAGLFISIDAMPLALQWIQYLCSLKYCVNLLGLIEFADDHIPDGQQGAVDALFNRNDISRDDLELYLGVMVGLYFITRIMAAVILAWRAKQFN